MSFKIASLSVDTAARQVMVQMRKSGNVKGPVISMLFPFEPDPNATQAANEETAKAQAKDLIQQALAAL